MFKLVVENLDENSITKLVEKFCDLRSLKIWQEQFSDSMLLKLIDIQLE